MEEGTYRFQVPTSVFVPTQFCRSAPLLTAGGEPERKTASVATLVER